MKQDTTEEVIARDVYEAGTTVRLRNGTTGTVENRKPAYASGTFVLWVTTSESRNSNRTNGECGLDGEETPYDIVGEVVTAPKAVVATKVKRAAVTSTRTEERVYSDGIVTHNGKVDGMTMEEARKERRYIDRCIDRLKRDAVHYGWEV